MEKTEGKIRYGLIGRQLRSLPDQRSRSVPRHGLRTVPRQLRTGRSV